MTEAIPHLEIVGPGRAGLALGSRLLEIGAVRRLTYSGRAAQPPDHALFRGASPAAGYRGPGAPRSDPPDGIILAVPDAAIATVAAELSHAELTGAPPVLHLSGALGSDALAPLARRGLPTGSLHPLVAFADDRAGARLDGAWFAVEGAPAARALGERIVAALNGHLLPLAEGEKTGYHAAAVAASNFVVALLGVAERWMIDSGVPPRPAREALATLAAGAVESYRRLGAVEALTGPVSRGDAETVRAHLARLSPSDRPLYSVLASSALTLARQRGLDPGAAAALARLLEPTE
ncbi:MAG TPA: Rossmann-like and DUF2520 domain-containing protein [Longimicrobiaceae bacterium]